MTSCVKELYDYDLVKKCSKCANLSLKNNFHRDKTKRDGLRPNCKVCRKQYYDENHDVIIKKQTKYEKNRYKTDINYRLIKNTRRRIHHALNGKSKSSSTKDILVIDIDLYRKWIEYQMSPEKTWYNIEIDHVKPICLFDVTEDEQLKEAFNWKNTQPLLKELHSQKGIKFNFLDYQLQFIKAYQFIKLNEERFN